MYGTSNFSQDAHQYVRGLQMCIVLIDGATLADLMIQSGLGVTTTAAYEVKRVDSDYFAEE